MELSLIVPVYNEAENFPRLVAEVERHVPPPYTMLVIHDFDEDTTLPVARSLAEGRGWIRLVRNEGGRGAASAIKTGFRAAASGPALVVMADLSDDLSLVPRMLSLYAEGNRIVCASRYARGGRQIGGPLLKRTLSRPVFLPMTPPTASGSTTRLSSTSSGSRARAGSSWPWRSPRRHSAAG